jgi:hypothetical protein
VALRIAFDLDGVLADMDSELVRQAEQLFGKAVPRRPADPSEEAQGAEEAPAEITPPLLQLNLTGRQQRKLWRHVESVDNFWQTLEEVEAGSVQRLAAAAAEGRWEILFLTKRPSTAGTTVQLQTQRWLESKGFALPSVFVVQGSRGRIAASLALDIVVDDRPENCLDVVADSKARAILVWRDERTAVPTAARRLGIGVVRSVADCLDILTTVDSQPPSEGGVLDRVRRLLGLKEPASA